jgi:hypothetical protein
LGGSTSEDYPARISVADVNGDGLPDVVSPEPAESVGVLLGRGDGSLAPPLSFAAPGGASFTAVADFDGDGAQDIAWVTYENAGVLFGDGTGLHWGRIGLPPADYTGIVVGDFDGDGTPDIAAVSRGDKTLRVFLSRPGRAFQPVTGVHDSLGGTVWGMKVGDFDRDGHADIAISLRYTYPDLVVLLGRGNGTFRLEYVEDRDIPEPRGMDVADATGDGLADLVVAERQVITIFPGLGNGSFGAKQSMLLVPESTLDVAVSDVTGDAIPDLVTTDQFTGALVTRPGLGHGAFGPPIESVVGCSMFPVVLEDLDGDGRLDAVSLMMHADGVAVARGDGAGRWGASKQTIPLASNDAAMEAGDLDGDGSPDLVCLTGWAPQTGVEVLLGRPGRVFVHSPRVPVDGSNPVVHLADLDEDGHLDAAVLLDLSKVAILRGNGDGTLAPAAYLALTPSAYGFDLADVNGDHHVDFVTANRETILVRPGRGDGTFGTAIASPFGFTVARYVVGDLNGDGVPDLGLLLRGYNVYGVARAVGKGDGTFEPDSPAWLNGSLSLIAIADVDHDGRADLLFAYDDCSICSGLFTRTMFVELQQADGSLGPPIASRWPNLYSNAIQVADLDRDGDDDVLVSNDAGFGVVSGSGTGRFAMEGGYGCLFQPHPFVAADFDGDGRIDVAAADGLGLGILYGRDPTPPSADLIAPRAGASLAFGRPATICWRASDNVGVAGVDVLVSRHGPRGAFERIALVVANTGQYSWIVTAPASDSVAFKVVARDSAGNVAHATSVGLISIGENVAVEPPVAAAKARLTITSIAPNPAHGRFIVRFTVPGPGWTTLALYDLQGREIARLLDAPRPAGPGAVEWSAAGALRPRSGLYFLRLAADGRSAFRRVVLAQ